LNRRKLLAKKQPIKHKEVMSGFVEKIAKASHELERRKSLKMSQLPSLQQETVNQIKDPLLFLEG
jgi:hypothetical protein